MSKYTKYPHLTIAAVTMFLVLWALWSLAYQVRAEVGTIDYPQIGEATVVSR